MTETFWVEPTGEALLSLRRYSRDEDRPCGKGWSYHSAEVPVGRAPVTVDASGFLHASVDAPPSSDPRWPTSCDRCDYQFRPGDGRQLHQVRLYRCPDTAEEWPQDELPPGAMFNADWLPAWWKGSDGIGLVVILPTADRHPWHVDAESSNCTRKGDGSHKCWVRHGDPRTDRITVDKNGETCQAGAGSIAVEGYHGFLQNGVLT